MFEAKLEAVGVSSARVDEFQEKAWFLSLFSTALRRLSTPVTGGPEGWLSSSSHPGWPPTECAESMFPHSSLTLQTPSCRILDRILDDGRLAFVHAAVPCGTASRAREIPFGEQPSSPQALPTEGGFLDSVHWTNSVCPQQMIPMTKFWLCCCAVLRARTEVVHRPQG